jgi:hypothetical protein
MLDAAGESLDKAPMPAKHKRIDNVNCDVVASS